MKDSITAALIVAAVAAVFLAVAGTHHNHSDTPHLTRRLVEVTNQHRVDNGLNELVEDAELAAFAQNWAEQLAAAGELSHRSSRPGNKGLAEQAIDAGVALTVIGENVGRGASIEELHQAFQQSPTHAANLTDSRWERIGVGAAVADSGEIYVAVNFADPTP